jgi:hypothetical protein
MSIALKEEAIEDVLWRYADQSGDSGKYVHLIF